MDINAAMGTNLQTMESIMMDWSHGDNSVNRCSQKQTCQWAQTVGLCSFDCLSSETTVGYFTAIKLKKKKKNSVLFYNSDLNNESYITWWLEQHLSCLDCWCSCDGDPWTVHLVVVLTGHGWEMDGSSVDHCEWSNWLSGVCWSGSRGSTISLRQWEIGGGTSWDTLMNRWGLFFLFFFSLFPHYFHWSAKASQVCAISQCQHLSIRLIQLRLRQLRSRRLTGVSLILPIAFVPFVFSAHVTALPATCTGRRREALLGEGHSGEPIRSHEQIYYSYLIWLSSTVCVCVCVPFSTWLL